VDVVRPCSDPEKISLAPPVLSQVTPMVVGLDTDSGRQQTVQELISHVAASFGLSADSFSLGCSITSRKKNRYKHCCLYRKFSIANCGN
jgi:hypothetical protein